MKLKIINSINLKFYQSNATDIVSSRFKGMLHTTIWLNNIHIYEK